MLALLKQKDQHYRNMIKKIMTDELYSALQDLNTAKGKVETLAVLILALTGFTVLAAENVYSFLHRERNQVMANAMRALSKKAQSV